ncbi:phosphotransferase [Viridibacillus sp. YIM B01967]|uniref:Phosphotransferase n=1 Tax=Viridibacillus soli TaxID=2798301 RepID=A0ABS1H458_9BACL|nr:phosphotransferase [Viridibacillus soli]MBK3494197.1 phosphotransferase [Viridibacillus soli]
MKKDRCDTLATWTAIKNNWGNVQQFPTRTDMELLIRELVNRTSLETQWIHGDLGIWNTLYNGELFIIDFGEARMGHPYFDLAAILTSNAPAHCNDDELRHYINHFVAFYSKVETIDIHLLNDFISLWFIRGVLTAYEQKAFDAALIFFNLYTKYKRAFA